eukprot:m.189285 g.189285  ORF g.189285 m.189285 type:complete len:692 (-) comp24853_c0_seq2:1257-3332(-)
MQPTRRRQHWLSGLLLMASVARCSVATDDAVAETLRKEADGLAKQGSMNAALKKMASALGQASSTNAKVRLASGMLHARVNQMDTALSVYRDAIRVGEGVAGAEKYVAMAHNNVCVELDTRGEHDAAFQHCKMAARLPNFWYPHKTLGLISDKWSNVDEAKAHFLEAHKITRNDAIKLHATTILPLVYQSEADLQARKRTIESGVAAMLRSTVIIPDVLSDLITVPHFYSAFFGTNNVKIYRDIARVLLKSDVQKAPNDPLRLGYIAPFVTKLHRGGLSRVANRQRIRVGFSSMFFREHASGRMIQGIIAGLSRDRFEVIVFCLREKLGSPPYSGTVADRIRHRADKFIELPKPRGLAFLRSAIEAEMLDVLIFAEIGMDPANYLLAFSRLAPVQVVTHGHASTTGIPTLDYFVSYKPFELPGAQQFYSEKLVSFSDFSPYYRPELPAAIPTRAALVTDLDLDDVVTDNTIVFVCLQTLFKLTPNFDPVFGDILRRLPTARLVLKTFRSTKVNERLLERMRQSIPDVFDRITVLPSLSTRQWYGLLRHSDIVLDSYPFGGYTTTLEVLAAGSTPIVTLPHEQMAGRCTKGFFDILGIDDTVALTKTQYVDIAVRLGVDRAFRLGVEAQLETNSDALWERQGAMGEWEEFLEQVTNGSIVSNLHTRQPSWRRIRSKHKGTQSSQTKLKYTNR